jgi:hypothetical protein
VELIGVTVMCIERRVLILFSVMCVQYCDIS